MARTELTGDQILDGTVGRDDLDVTTLGQSAITKVVAGTGVTLSWTGADQGTGDVTVNFAGGGGGIPSGGAESLVIKDSIGNITANVLQTETNPTPTETNRINATAIFAETNPTPSETNKLSIAGYGDTNAGQTETNRINATATYAETNPVQTETNSFSLNMTFTETNLVQAETNRSNLTNTATETNALPTEARSSTTKAWLSGSTGTSNVTNPANANGTNNGVSSSQQTVALGTVTSTLTSACGAGLPTGIAYTAVQYRGWFNASITAVTSTIAVILRSSNATFTDITMLSTTASVNHNTGTFVFTSAALSALTLTQLRTAQVIHTTTDAVAGATPAILTVDAGSIELTNAI